MCGRYSLTATLEEILKRFQIDSFSLDFDPGYNIAPGQHILAIIEDSKSQRKLGRLKWGFIPSWSKEAKPKALINARAETIADKPTFRDSFTRKRCLIPADSFYEWQVTDNGKQPMRVMLKNGQLFAFAGIYDTWLTPEGDKLSTCAIITTAPNDLMSGIHDRMPVMLTNEDKWLDRSAERRDLFNLLTPFPTSEMTAYPVSKSLGNVNNNSKACLERVDLSPEQEK